MLILLAGCAGLPSGSYSSASDPNFVWIGPNESIKLKGAYWASERERNKYRCLQGIMIWDVYGAGAEGSCYNGWY